MFTPANQLQDHFLGALPVVKEHPIRQSNNDIPLTNEFQVSATILLELPTQMVSSAVDLNNQSIANQKVDSTDATDINLNAVSNAIRTQKQAESGLEPRL